MPATREIRGSEIIVPPGTPYSYNSKTRQFALGAVDSPQRVIDLSRLSGPSEIVEQASGFSIQGEQTDSHRLLIGPFSSVIVLPELRRWLVELGVEEQEVLTRQMARVMADVYRRMRSTAGFDAPEKPATPRVSFDELGTFTLSFGERSLGPTLNPLYISYNGVRPDDPNLTVPIELKLFGNPNPAERIAFYAAAGTLASPA